MILIVMPWFACVLLGFMFGQAYEKDSRQRWRAFWGRLSKELGLIPPQGCDCFGECDIPEHHWAECWYG